MNSSADSTGSLNETSKHRFAPGFRLSIFDGIVLVAGGVLATFASSYETLAGIVIAIVVLQFFLFCNVFRIRRKPELIWSAAFVLSVLSTIYTSVPGWPLALGLSAFLAAILILLEIKRPDYHGILWQCLNPNLHEWWLKNRRSSVNESRNPKGFPLP